MLKKLKLFISFIINSRKAVDVLIQAQAKVSDLKRQNEDLLRESYLLKRKLDDVQDKFDAVATRNNQMEYNARVNISDTVLAQAYAVDPKTRLLIITTADKNAVTAATYANLNNKISRICKNLDAMIMIGNVSDLEQLTKEEAASRYGIVPIPEKAIWDKSKDAVIESLSALFDKYAKEKELSFD